MRRLVLALALIATPVLAVQPDEMLSDPDLEARARAISRDLRCPVCQGENIDDSNAAISRDLRLYVRERLVAGDSDRAVVDNVIERFGEFVLFQPRATGANLILWLAGPLMALIGAFAGWRFLRGRDQATPMPDDLSAEEKTRLRDIMGDD
ncbi:cytochrome c-type biogenesis protein CcmH [Paracoccus sp. 1_MG-2023]|uniref:cytochrome c-type biogenesis protein n=1 Tax=unclassified Paracoccus (in: a-proteobacteria) TaxID=2688777 RepID=UPI001C09764B|nr:MULTISPECIES: cytochrome c-type biogenesis protein [unclassified Paracoccus (in: a-proteobacteria)]MBU2956758.1 cytochrome c-type biogenesis protein CcmH [Paracoccus sp. C2R09]MDO6669203.1 cytochrome c-type biogenesis protein CcmH [Paracoccus sp. 1_MG-2023]